MKIIITLIIYVMITIPLFSYSYKQAVERETDVTIKITGILSTLKNSEVLKKKQDELKKLDKELARCRKNVIVYKNKYKENSVKLKKISQEAIKENIRVGKLGDFKLIYDIKFDTPKYEGGIISLQIEMIKELSNMVNLLKKIKESSDLEKYNIEFVKIDKKLNLLGESIMKCMDGLEISKTKLATLQQRLSKEVKGLEATPQLYSILNKFKNIK